MASRLCSIFFGIWGIFVSLPTHAVDDYDEPATEIVDLSNFGSKELETTNCNHRWSDFFSLEEYRRYFSKSQKSALIFIFLLAKTGLDIASIVFIAEQMRSIKDLQHILSEFESNDCDSSCMGSIEQMSHRASNAYLTDGVCGITFSMLATISDMVALRAYLLDSKTAALKPFMVSSTLNLATFVSTFLANLNFWNAKQASLVELPPHATDALSKVIIDGAKVVVPTFVNTIPASLVLWYKYCAKK